MPDGCHVWLCVPQLGWAEYHPFSVASCAGTPAFRNHLLLHMKAYDKWTQVLHCCPQAVTVFITLHNHA